MPVVSGAHLWLSNFTRQTLVLCVCICTSALLNGCGGAGSPTSGLSETSTTSENSSNPSIVAPLIPGTGPPGSDQRPPKPGESGRPIGADGLPQLQVKGINYEQLFTERLDNDKQRFDRLETAVLELRRDFESVLPSLIRLVAVENDIQNLVGQLETLLDGEPPAPAAPALPLDPVEPEPIATPEPTPTPAPAPSPAPAPAASQAPATPPVSSPPSTVSAALHEASAAPSPMVKAEPEKAAPIPVSAAEGQQITGLRFGGSGGKTRIVFDAVKPVTYTKDLDNSENLLVIELPGTGWSTAAQGKGPSSSVVDSWSSQPTGDGGSRVVMVLKKPVTVAYEGKVGPESDNPYNRLVLDLAAN